MAWYKVILVGKTFEAIEAAEYYVCPDSGTVCFSVKRGKKSILSFMCLTDNVIAIHKVPAPNRGELSDVNRSQ